MVTPEPELDKSIGQCQMQELANRYGMTREDMESIVYDIQQKDLSLEWLKQPRVQQIVKHRKGRWVHVSAIMPCFASYVLYSPSKCWFGILLHPILQEEAQFAAFLAKEFCLGMSEIENGTTKRVYLSSKLACTKMRISKKFKGKLFLSWCSCLPPFMPSFSLWMIQDKILVKKFLRNELQDPTGSNTLLWSLCCSSNSMQIWRQSL